MNSFFISDKSEVPTLVLTGAWTNDAAEYMKRNGIVGLRLSGYLGWRAADLEFLHTVPFVEHLDILTTTLTNISGLYALKELSFLSLEGRTPPVEFSRLSRLKTLALGRVSDHIYTSLVRARTIRKLGLTCPTEHQLTLLGELHTLQDLGISSARIHDLSFVIATPGLRKLSLVGCNLMQNLRGLENAQGLLVLVIEQARALSDLATLSHMRKLRTLVLRDCPHIETINPLKGLLDLETIGFMHTTNVRDGDLSPLKTLPKLSSVRFVERKHYNQRLNDFPQDGVPFY